MDEPVQPSSSEQLPDMPLPTNPPGASVPPQVAQEPPAPLVYEETPEITMETPSSAGRPQAQAPAPAARSSGSCLRAAGILFLVVILVVAGVWVSDYVRRYIPQNVTPGTSEKTEIQKKTESIVTPEPVRQNDPYAGWITYEVKSGTTRLPIPGLTFKLPSGVLAPICDISSCVSQGTYLPGGTRLTVAARGAGQALRDFRGSLITDANGIAIPVTQVPLGNLVATEYTSSVSGRTVSGYVFTRIRGAMIPLTDTLSVEVNHFLPFGIKADFDADDILFHSVINTFTYVSTPSGATATPAVQKFQNATSSGY